MRSFLLAGVSSGLLLLLFAGCTAPPTKDEIKAFVGLEAFTGKPEKRPVSEPARPEAPKPTPSTTQAKAATLTITITDTGLSPFWVRASKSARVVWMNKTSGRRVVGLQFRQIYLEETPQLKPGGSWSLPLSKISPGLYNYNVVVLSGKALERPLSGVLQIEP